MIQVVKLRRGKCEKSTDGWDESRTSEELSFALFRSAPGLALRSLRRTLWFLKGGQFTAFLCGPAGFIDLAPAGNSQSIRRHVFRDGRTGSDVGAVAHAHRRDQRRIAADEHFAPDRGGMLMKAVVIAGDRAGADIALRSDLGIAEVREVHGFCAFADRALFEFDEIADARASFQVIVWAKPRKWTNDDAVVEPALRHHAMRLDGYIVSKNGVSENAARSNGTTRADSRFAQQLHSRLDDGVFAHGDIRINQDGFRKLNGHARIHQNVAFPLAENAVDSGELRAGIAS